MSPTDRLRGESGERAGASLDRPALADFPCVIRGRHTTTGQVSDVRSPYDDSLVATVHRAGPREIEQAIAGADESFAVTRRLPSWHRSQILEKVSAAIAARTDEFVRVIALEAGKPLKAARLEVTRAVFTFKVAAEETRRIYGEIVPLDWLPGNERREAHVIRVPLGPVAGITPFNFPLNLVAHKVAPAMAAGDPVIIRPASQTPVSSLKLADIILEAGWPADAISVVPSSTGDAAPLVEDDRIRLLSFTGSPAVGWDLKRRAGRKRVTLELGGNAAVIVHSDADLEYAAERITWGGFSYAGQSCISVQRVYVHAPVYEKFRDLLVARVKALKAGDPLDESTDVGPLIDRTAGERVREWMDEARAAGARVLAGGEARGSVWQPTLLENVDPAVRVSCQEVFAPLVGLVRYDDVGAAIAAADAGDFGLQAGVFTHDERIITAAIEGIEAGGVMVNDVSTFRIDHMPYGGVKLSGFGREGVRYAIEEMTEMKLVTYNRRA
ncbi:MAG TPA: aldehyde dehydrogenase family protein [Vicinamibacterales bacterium]|nr:aldehyde dehydrogenase family protein [Vicinamibacterales bacterium]